MGRITTLGTGWEWRHSLWMVFLLLPFTVPLSYFYVGIRMQNRRWIALGFIYFLAIDVVIYLLDVFVEIEDLIIIIAVPSIVGGYFNGIYTGKTLRKSYLLFLAENMDPEKRHRLEEREQHIQQYKHSNVLTRTEIKKHQSAQTQFAITEKAKNKNIKVINMNKSTVSDIAQLPQIGGLLAQKIVQVRGKIERFTSFEHLVKETGIQAHILETAREYMAYQDEEIGLLQEQLEKKQQRLHRQNKNIPGRSVEY